MEIYTNVAICCPCMHTNKRHSHSCVREEWGLVDYSAILPYNCIHLHGG